ncbi:MAG: hypothetical protein K2X27_19050, partial [Candidatus Obscuribacterales bacterium]|nr:hypothetical protein [Candidatus Obscuribacterales bacterium]
MNPGKLKDWAPHGDALTGDWLANSCLCYHFGIMKAFNFAALFLLFAFSTSAALAAGAAVKPLKAEEIKNCRACIPSIGQSDDALVTFKNGEFHSADYPFAEMRAMAFGTLNGKAVAVAELCWNTGGSGNWETILLFARKDGKVVCKGSYTPGAD